MAGIAGAKSEDFNINERALKSDWSESLPGN
jgi:hypothetical protein